MTDVEVTPQEILGAGAGGPLPPSSPWLIYSGYIGYTGGIVIGLPTGGNKGTGTINCQDYYINGQKFDFSTVLPITGGTLTGPLIQAADPVNVLGTATKQYVDAAKASAGVGIFLPLAGGALTGALTLSADPTTSLQPATMQYVISRTPIIVDAPSDSNYYTRRNGGWAITPSGVGTFLQLSGGTLTGPLTLAADPTIALGTATKQYVDGKFNVAGVGTFLPLAGGTMTGAITLPADPTVSTQASTKNYVDGRTPITTDAPNDGNYYVRRNLAWILNPAGITIPDAPQDGSTYGRNNGAWTNVHDAGTF
jgi:hypothetical protein